MVKFLISRGAVFAHSPVSNSDIILQMAKLLIGGAEGERQLLEWIGIDEARYCVDEKGVKAGLIEVLMSSFPYIESFQGTSRSTDHMLVDCLGELEWTNLQPLVAHICNPRISLLLIAIIRDQLNRVGTNHISVSLAASSGHSDSKLVTIDSSIGKWKLFDQSKTFTVKLRQDNELEIIFLPRKLGQVTEAFVHLETSVIKLVGACAPTSEPTQILKAQSRLYEEKAWAVSILNPFPDTGNFTIEANSVHDVGICSPTELRIGGNQSELIGLVVIGFVVSSVVKTYLVFRDDSVGEFTVNLEITIGPPRAPTDVQILFDALATERETKILQVHRLNGKLEDSMNLFPQKRTGVDDSLHFKVESTSAAFEFECDEPTVRFDSRDQVDIPITFKPNRIGRYLGILSLTSCDGRDVRVYKLEGIAKAAPIRIEVRLEGSARERVEQTICLRQECNYSVLFMNSGKIPEFLSIDIQPDVCRILARAIKPVTSDIVFELVNDTTSHSLYVSVEVKVDVPLAECRLAVSCVARQTTPFRLMLPAFTQCRRFLVETDLDDIFGAHEIATLPDLPFEYEVRIKACSNKKSVGSISFMDVNSGETMWYVIEIQAEPPADAGELTLNTFIRKPMLALIQLHNPTDVEAEFAVGWEGDGLTGLSSFTISAKASYDYQLTYLPQVAVQTMGSLAFYSDQIGDVWYRLKLEAKLEEYITYLEPVECVLGSTTIIDLSITNTLEVPLILSPPKIDGIQVEELRLAIDKLVQVPPRETHVCRAELFPASVGIRSPCRISFEDRSSGIWVFQFQPRIVPPTREKPLEIIKVTSELGSQGAGEIRFNNPLMTLLEVRIKSSDEALVIMLRKPLLVLQPQQTVSIPFIFTPTSMEKLEVIVTIASQEFQWTYLVNTITERPVDRTTPSVLLIWKCREEAELIQSFGIDCTPGSRLEVSVEAPSEFSKIAAGIVASLKSVDSGKVMISFKARFFRPLTFPGLLHVAVQDKSDRWRIPVQIEVIPPPVDDVIKIESSLNQKSFVSFDLRNTVNELSEFKAYFSPLSKVFSVSPSKGVMKTGSDPEPMNRFILSFNPKEYGRGACCSKLVIETETAFWSFMVKGSLPEFKPRLIHRR